MIQLKINNMDHKAILTVPADYERVVLALWTIGLDRDPEKYTLRQLDAEFTYTTEEESQMVRLIDFEMISPVEVQMVVNEGTAILPTEELMGKVKDHLSLTGAQEAYLFGVVESWCQNPISCKIEMNRMEFGLARVKVANKDLTYYYVPAFVVYGSTYFYDSETGEKVVFPYEETAAAERALVWINAVDGTIIDAS